MIILLVNICFLLHSTLAGNCDIPGTEHRCEEFYFKGEKYKKGDCKYDYHKEKSWCAIRKIDENEDIGADDWQWCPDSCDTDKIDCTADGFEQKSDGLWYRLSNNEHRRNAAKSRCESKDSILAHAESEANLDAIKSIINQNAANGQDIWIGLKKKSAPANDSPDAGSPDVGSPGSGSPDAGSPGGGGMVIQISPANAANGGYVADQVIWDKTGQDYQFGHLVSVVTSADGDECVAIHYDSTQPMEDQYMIMDKECNDNDDEARTLCQKECGAGEGKVA